jgi:hypothetical protein
MEPILKLFLSACCMVVCISCGEVDASAPAHPSGKNLLIIVVDKSHSVSYAKQKDKISSELKRKFSDTYDSSYEDLQIARMTIEGSTKPFAEHIRFLKKCPAIDPQSRSEEQELENWRHEKKRWLDKNRNEVLQLIDSTNYSNKTDIFNIFGGIQDAQENSGPWDKVDVIIFSDMIHTLNDLNMQKGLTVANAYGEGQAAFQSLLKEKRIERGGTQDIRITIYTPDEMNSADAIKLFWKGFFEEWGLNGSQVIFQ